MISVSAVCRLPPARSASLPGGLLFQKARQVKAARGVERRSWGALVLALTPCYTCDPAREARMQHRWRSGARGFSGICSSPSILLMSVGERGSPRLARLVRGQPRCARFPENVTTVDSDTCRDQFLSALQDQVSFSNVFTLQFCECSRIEDTHLWGCQDR